jgi:hypothetical protein
MCEGTFHKYSTTCDTRAFIPHKWGLLLIWSGTQFFSLYEHLHPDPLLFPPLPPNPITGVHHIQYTVSIILPSLYEKVDTE